MHHLNRFKNQVKSDTELFRLAIDNAPMKNNIYQTYTFFLLHNEGQKDKEFIVKCWETLISRLHKGKESDLLNLYIHFPFCKSPCDYCVYPSTTFKGEKQVNDYLDFLSREVDTYSELFKDLTFKNLSIGGGTPNMMTVEQLDWLLNKIFSNFSFDKQGEKGIEFNPSTVTPGHFKTIEKYGFNRVSFGVQSLSESVLEKINRSYQNSKKITNAIKDLKSTNISFLNLDMLMGLFGDTKKDFLYSFEELCKLQPDSLSIYPIKTNEHYIKARYNSFDEFQEYYYNLFDEVIPKLPAIAKKYGYSIPYSSKDEVSYVHPVTFMRKDFEFRYSYANFSTEPYSNLGLGFYAQSCINNLIRYQMIDRNHPDCLFLKSFSTDEKDFTYTTMRFARRYSRVKFIVHETFKKFSVDREKYKKRFGKDIIEEFPYACKALHHLNKIKITDDKIAWNVKDERETYVPLLFFSGRDNVKKALKMLNVI